MTRALKWALLTLLGVAAAVAGALVFVAGNSNGSRWMVERALALSGASIEVSGLEGTLLEGMRADALRIHVDDTTIDVEAVEIAPAWVASFARRTFVVDRVSASMLRVTSTGSPDASPIAVALPALPLALDIRALSIEQTASNAFPESYAPAVRGRFSYDGSRYSLRAVDLQAAAYRVAGDLDVSRDQDVGVEGALTWHLSEPNASGRVELRDSLRQLGVTLRVDEPAAVDGRGTVRVLGEVQPRFDFDATLAEWVSEQVRVAGLTAHVAGSIDRFDVQASAAVNVPELPSAQVSIDAAGSLDALDIRQLLLTSERGRAVAQGHLARVPSFAIDLAMDVSDLDPGLFAATLSGAVSGHVALGISDDDIDVDVQSLAGRLNGAPFDAGGQIGRTDGTWHARGVEVRSGPNRASLALEWQNDRVSGQARLNMPNLATLLPELQGDLTARVVVSGRRDAPDVELSADSRSLRYREWRSANAAIEATVSEAKAGNARVTIATVSRDDAKLERIDAVVRGSLDALDGTLGWSMADQRGAMQLSAHRGGDQWDVAVAEGARLPLPGEVWRLDRDVRVRVVDAAFSVSAHCWLRPSESGRVCVDEAAVDGDRIRLAGAIDDLEVATIASRFEDAPRLGGTVSGRWDVAGDAGRWRGSARLNSEGLRLIGDGATGAGEGIDLPMLSAIAEFADDRATVSLRADNDSGRVVDLAVDVDGFDAASRLDGRATVSIEDLGFIATFTRRVGEVSGALRGDLLIGGTVAAPELRGALSIAGARIAVTEPRVELTSVDLTMRLSGADDWTLVGSARSDDGSVSIDGALHAPLSNARAFHARVEATDLPMSIPDVAVRIAGAVDVDWRPGLVAAKGRVEIPRANITLSELPPGAVAVSDDVVVVNRVETRPGGTRAQVDLEVVLKDNVHFAAFGLDTGLTGTLRMRQSADGIVQLNGTLSLVNGSFEIYGQKLAIESGRLTYTGPPQDPYVDATASRTIREITRSVTVGAHIQGPARAIETTLFSKPAMSDAETLSYLVLGRPLSSATAQEGNNVMGAAIALGLKGASPVIKEVSSVLGIDELTATGGSTEDLTVVAGKRFSDRVFVRYSYQTFTRASAILFELLLTRRLALEATASDIPAIDIIYKVGEND